MHSVAFDENADANDCVVFATSLRSIANAARCVCRATTQQKQEEEESVIAWLDRSKTKGKTGDSLPIKDFAANGNS